MLFLEIVSCKIACGKGEIRWGIIPSSRFEYEIKAAKCLLSLRNDPPSGTCDWMQSIDEFLLNDIKNAHEWGNHHFSNSPLF